MDDPPATSWSDPDDEDEEDHFRESVLLRHRKKRSEAAARPRSASPEEAPAVDGDAEGDASTAAPVAKVGRTLAEIIADLASDACIEPVSGDLAAKLAELGIDVPSDDAPGPPPTPPPAARSKPNPKPPPRAYHPSLSDPPPRRPRASNPAGATGRAPTTRVGDDDAPPPTIPRATKKSAMKTDAAAVRGFAGSSKQRSSKRRPSPRLPDYSRAATVPSDPLGVVPLGVASREILHLGCVRERAHYGPWAHLWWSRGGGGDKGGELSASSKKTSPPLPYPAGLAVRSTLTRKPMADGDAKTTDSSRRGRGRASPFGRGAVVSSARVEVERHAGAVTCRVLERRWDDDRTRPSGGDHPSSVRRASGRPWEGPAFLASFEPFDLEYEREAAEFARETKNATEGEKRGGSSSLTSSSSFLDDGDARSVRCARGVSRGAVAPARSTTRRVTAPPGATPEEARANLVAAMRLRPRAIAGAPVALPPADQLFGLADVDGAGDLGRARVALGELAMLGGVPAVIEPPGGPPGALAMIASDRGARAGERAAGELAPKLAAAARGAAWVTTRTTFPLLPGYQVTFPLVPASYSGGSAGGVLPSAVSVRCSVVASLRWGVKFVVELREAPSGRVACRGTGRDPDAAWASKPELAEALFALAKSDAFRDAFAKAALSRDVDGEGRRLAALGGAAALNAATMRGFGAHLFGLESEAARRMVEERRDAAAAGGTRFFGGGVGGSDNDAEAVAETADPFMLARRFLDEALGGEEEKERGPRGGEGDGKEGLGGVSAAEALKRDAARRSAYL